MTEARRLRLGILVALASGGALPALSSAGCGDVSVGQSGSASSSGSTTTGGAGGSTTTTSATTTSTATTTSATTSTTGAGGGSFMCPSGNPTQQCYTLEQLEQMINNPPMGGDTGDGGPEGGVVLTDCPEHGVVKNDCCIPASAGPDKQGDMCCYLFCESGCCGRAFVIGERAVVARTVQREDWLGEIEEEGERAIDEATRAGLSASWLRDAQMEHASIASFARFTLELLGLGAPPELIADSQRASLDEIEHARLCFALAARFGRAKGGPGPLVIAGAERPSGLTESVAAAVREGCIGETIAALVAREQLGAARDPAVKRALARIAADEERHAALAYRFIRWGIEAGGAAVREAARHALEEGMRAARTAPTDAMPDVDVETWRHFGRLDPAGMRAATRSALDEVIGPCAEAVIGTS